MRALFALLPVFENNRIAFPELKRKKAGPFQSKVLSVLSFALKEPKQSFVNSSNSNGACTSGLQIKDSHRDVDGEEMKTQPGASQDGVANIKQTMQSNGFEEVNVIDGIDDTKDNKNFVNSEQHGNATVEGNQHDAIKRPIVEGIKKATLDRDTTKNENDVQDDINCTLRPFYAFEKVGQQRQNESTQREKDKVKAKLSNQTVSHGMHKSFLQKPRVLYSQVGGIEQQLKDIDEIIGRPLRHPELYSWLGVNPPRGVLLHGPHGCGKTLLANAIGTESGVPFFSISAPEIASSLSGDSEAKIRRLFNEAFSKRPSIIFIDEIDAIAMRRDGSNRQMESRIVAQLLSCMDNLGEDNSFPEANTNDRSSEKTPNELDRSTGHVVVIGATSRPDALDPALRRAGRFDREIAIGVPDEKAREKILLALTQKLRVSSSVFKSAEDCHESGSNTFDCQFIAKRTPGYVGSDLEAVCKEAAAATINRVFRNRKKDKNPGTSSCPSDSVSLEANKFRVDELQSIYITQEDFITAIGRVQPSAQREGFASIPKISWDDVGSLRNIKEEIAFTITKPIMNPVIYESMGLLNSGGVLLYGPPGCGKTLVAKATANEADATFISVAGPELMNKYVGESEKAIRSIFARGRSAAPCILFFDEIDAIAPRRGGKDGNAVNERLVNQILTEMDGLEPRKGVYVIGATNRPDMIDPALLRPGRFGKLLYVPIPSIHDKELILRALTRNTPMHLDALDAACLILKEGDDSTDALKTSEGWSGADIAAWVREACICAIKEKTQMDEDEAQEGLKLDTIGSQQIQTETTALVRGEHFTQAFRKVSPSVSEQDRSRYEMLRKKLKGGVS